MEALAGPFGIAAALLAAAGAAKVVDPSMTAGALRASGLRIGAGPVRLAAAAELGLGAAALAVQSALLAVAVAASYFAFAAFVLRALRLDKPVGTCGCFGKADTPPSFVHVGVNLGLGGIAAAVGSAGGVDLPAVIADQPWLGVPFVAWMGLGIALAFLALTALPRTLAETRALRDRA